MATKIAKYMAATGQVEDFVRAIAEARRAYDDYLDLAERAVWMMGPDVQRILRDGRTRERIARLEAKRKREQIED